MTTFDLDPALRPQDDLFRHVNGRWLASTPIPDDRPSYGATQVLREQAEEAVRDIVTGLQNSTPGTEAAKVENLFASFMNTDEVERRGLDPVAALLAEVYAVQARVERCSRGRMMVLNDGEVA